MKNLVFVGGFSETIELFELTINLSSPEETHLKNISSTKVGKNPAFLALNNHGLYCVHEVRMITNDNNNNTYLVTNFNSSQKGKILTIVHNN